MRFITTDGEFGFLLAPAGRHGFYRFQLVFGENLVGDTEPCMAGSCFGPLASIREIEDPRLRQAMSGEDLLGLLQIDDDLNANSLKHLTESLDEWSTRAFIHDERTVLIVRHHDTGLVFRAAVEANEFGRIVDALSAYWRAVQSSTAPPVQ